WPRRAAEIKRTRGGCRIRTDNLLVEQTKSRQHPLGMRYKKKKDRNRKEKVKRITVVQECDATRVE
ncbi:MAG: hypothetical protein ACXWCG_07565, partial [Flavitalea sp.]